MNNEKKIPLILFIIFLLILSSALFWRTKKNPPTPQLMPSVSPTPGAYMSLKARDGKVIYKKGEPIVLEVITNSNNIPISGYDINVAYEGVFRFKGFTSLDSGFTAVASNLPDDSSARHRIGITASVPLGKQMMALHDTVLGLLTFEPVGKLDIAGAWPFSLEYSPGSKKDSNLISTASQDILEKVSEPVFVAYGKQITLFKNKIVTTSDGVTLYLRLISTTVPSSDCRDCITSTQVEFSETANFSGSKVVDFSSGGIAGQVDLAKVVFNWHTAIESVLQDRVTIILARPGG